MVQPPQLPLPASGNIEPRYALLINPFYPKDPHGSFGKHVLTPSTALTSIAASTPRGWRVTFWDENLLQGPPPSHPMPQVVGITVHLTFAKRAYELAAWFRAQGVTVVLGGMHVMACPQEVAPHADVLAIGDGVQLWPQILNDLASGTLKKRYFSTFASSYHNDPAPRRDIIPRQSFLTTASIIATRGCRNRCGFCFLSTRGLAMPYQTREVDQVIEEIKQQNEPYAVFIDNNLGSDPAYLRRLCRALRPLEKIWSAAVSLDVTDDPSLVREMALAGCTGVFVGFESLSKANLVDAGKRTPMPEEYKRRVAIFRDNGIQVNGSFVVGFDHDTREVFAQLAKWIEEARLECATFHILTPYPGTPLFRKLESQGRLLHKNWDLYDTAHAVFRPQGMTPEELEQGYSWLYQRLFSLQSIWHRRPADSRAVLPYLAMSLLYKKSNWLWQLLIRTRLTHAVWRPMVEWTRLRHLRFRRRLESSALSAPAPDRPQMVVSAGV